MPCSLISERYTSPNGLSILLSLELGTLLMQSAVFAYNLNDNLDIITPMFSPC